MTVSDFFNNLNPAFLFLFKNNFTISVIHYTSIFLINVIAYAYVFAKLFKTLCFSKMTFDWLPMINPYVWPFSFFRIVTQPYFSLWSTLLPSIKFEKSSMDVSNIIALEALNTLVFLLTVLTNEILMILEETEKFLIT